MRVVSFVPSWTETLVCAGVNIVGRTRFCIHPDQQVKSITVVGGTKDILLDQVVALKPDLVIFDKEENNQEMYQLCVAKGLHCVVTHVIGLQTCGRELQQLGQVLNNKMLKTWGEKYLQLTRQNRDLFQECVVQGDFLPDQSYQYVIWKRPYMTVARQTFIGDMLSLFGIELMVSDKKYPEISEHELKKHFCLFSTEPFPFAQYFQELKKSGYQGVLVDGEKLSWYGIRALRFLKVL